MSAVGDSLLPSAAEHGTVAVCSHCLLPVGRNSQRRSVNGEELTFCCYGCCIAYQVRHGVGEEHEAAWLLVRLGIGAFLAMNIMLFSLLLYSGSLATEDAGLRRSVHVLLGVLATPVLAILGEPFLRGAWQAARGGRASADTLVSLGALGAYGYSVYAVATGAEAVYFDTVTMVLVIFTLGRYFEALGRAQALRSLAPLLAAEEATATVVENGHDCVFPARLVVPGTVVRVKPGERVPVDGVVVEGESDCDESVLTGQLERQLKTAGTAVAAGSLNGTGTLLLRTTAAGRQSAWGRHARFVREALGRRSLTSELVDRIAALFVPAVLLLAFATLLYWKSQAPFAEAAMTALAVLVVACPCALGLAAPLATALGLGTALERGILLRGGSVLERLARVRLVAFDKTGTLTRGAPRLVALRTDGATEAELLQRAAGLAQGSEHPIARAILAAATSQGLATFSARHLRTQPGEGIAGEIDGDATAMGSARYMTRFAWTTPAPLHGEAADSRTAVFVGWKGAVRGLLLLEDPPLAEARAVVTALRERGLVSALVSGDGPAAVARLAEAAGIDTWEGGLSPLDKVAFLETSTRAHGPAAMVGDGLNDGPVLAAASVGIAVGDASDLAREAADIRLPAGHLDALPWLIDHARLVRRRILVNVLWAFGYNGIALTLAVCGLLQPVLAAGLMAGSSLLVVANSVIVGRAGRARAEAA